MNLKNILQLGAIGGFGLLVYNGCQEKKDDNTQRTSETTHISTFNESKPDFHFEAGEIYKYPVDVDVNKSYEISLNNFSVADIDKATFTIRKADGTNIQMHDENYNTEGYDKLTITGGSQDVFYDRSTVDGKAILANTKGTYDSLRVNFKNKVQEYVTKTLQ